MNTNKLFEVREAKSGRHLDFINAKDLNSAQAVFDYKYVNENGTSDAELHTCTNIAAKPAREGKSFTF